MTLPDHFGLYVLGAGLLAAIVLIVLGVVRVVRLVGVLRQRIEAYEDLSVLKLLEITEARLTAAEQRAAGIPQLRARAVAAVDELQNARRRTVLILRSALLAVRQVFAVR